MNDGSPSQQADDPHQGLRRRLVAYREELKTKGFWKGVRSEFLGTFLYVLLGCGGVTLRNAHEEESDLNSFELRSAFSFGLAEYVCLHCFSVHSGGHFNPALTLGMFCARYLTFMRSFAYVIAQLVGAVLGAAVLYGLVPDAHRGHLGASVLHSNIDKGQAFGVEFLMTFIYVLTFCASLKVKDGVAVPKPLPCSGCIVVTQLFATWLTGASLNPARSLGPALIMNVWKDHWIFWVGPMLGGILGALTFEYTKSSTVVIKAPKLTTKTNVYSLHTDDDVTSVNSALTNTADYEAGDQTSEDFQI